MQIIIRLTACFILSFVFLCSFSSEVADSSRTKLKASSGISLNSNGIASIPAFSLGKPAIIATIGLAKGHFSFDPVLAYGINMKPWFIDAWLHYMLIDKPAFKLRTGFNFSNFFSEYKLPDRSLLQSERYWALEFAGFYYFTPQSNLSLMYWRDMGQESGTISGHYISLAGEKSDFRIGKSLLCSAYFQIFYIGYDGQNDGLFVAPKISMALKEKPFSLFFQLTQAIKTNITPSPGFKWNIGLSYVL